MKGIKKIIVTMTCGLVTQTAFSAAFMLTEQSMAGLGRSYAGAGIVGDDLSATWYNPAGLTLLDGTQFQMGSGLAWIDFKYHGEDGNRDDARKGIVPVPNLFVTHQLNDTVTFGLGVTVPYGMEIDYKDTGKEWGRNKGTNAKLRLFDFNPSLGFKINDTLSVGVGFSAQYGECVFSTGSGPYSRKNDDPYITARLDVKDWGFGGNAGLMWQATKSTRFGLSWRSSTRLNLEGDLATKVRNVTIAKSPATMLFRTPQQVMLTATSEISPDIRVSMMARWADWSTFKSMDIRSTQKMEIPMKYRDSWLATIGMDYHINEAFTWRCGVGYEIGAQDDERLRLRSVPETNRLWLSLGATWRVNKDLQGDFGYLFLTGIGSNRIYDVNGTKPEGHFDRSIIHMAGAQFVYRFR